MQFGSYPLVPGSDGSDTFLMLHSNKVKQTQIACSTITALKAVTVTSLATGAMRIVEGYSSASDGSGGIFVYDSTSVASANDGTIIAPNAGSGRWLRIYSGPMSVKFFGATGDGTTDDTVAFGRAFSALGTNGGTLFCPNGTYRFTSKLNVPANVTILGEGPAQQRLNGGLGTKRPTRLLKDGSFDGVELNECSALEKLSVDGANGNGGGGVIMSGARTLLRDVGVFSHATIGIEVNGNANSWQIENVTSGWNGSHGFYIHSGTNNANIGSAINLIAWTNGGDGFRVNSSFESVFTNCYAESNTGYGWRIMTLARFQNYVGCGGEANGTPVVFEAGSENNAWIGASNMYQPTDNGQNSTMIAQGGEVGYAGWVSNGMIRAGVNPGPIGAFLAKRGFAAHGGGGHIPGYCWYDANGAANNRCWEVYSNPPTLVWRFSDDDGGNPCDFLTFTRHAGIGSYADMILSSGSKFYASRMALGTNGAEINAIWSGVASLNYPNIPAHDISDLTITVTGARVEDGVFIGPRSLEAGIVLIGWVSSNDTVTVRAHNILANPVDPAAVNVRVVVTRFA